MNNTWNKFVWLLARKTVLMGSFFCCHCLGGLFFFPLCCRTIVWCSDVTPMAAIVSIFSDSVSVPVCGLYQGAGLCWMECVLMLSCMDACVCVCVSDCTVFRRVFFTATRDPGVVGIQHMTSLSLSKMHRNVDAKSFRPLPLLFQIHKL